MTFTHAISTNNYGPAKFVVSSSAANGTHTTIQSALTAATSGDTVFVRTGTYTENLTLKAGVNLAAWVGDGTTANVNIVGKCTLTAGVVTISGIRLTTNGDYCIVMSGSSTSLLTLIECYIQSGDHTGISNTSSNVDSALRLWRCEGNTGLGFAVFENSSTGSFGFRDCSFTNTGASSTASTTSGSVSFDYTTFSTPLATTGAGGYQINYSNFNTGNNTCLTTVGTGTTRAEYSDFVSGSASAISAGTGTNVSIDTGCRVNSSNTNALTGAGTITYSTITYTGSSSIMDAAIQSPHISIGGGWARIKKLDASTSASLNFTTLPTYSVYAVVFVNVLAATNAQDFEMQVSVDNGSNYTSSGYTSGINYSAYNSATVTNATATTYGMMAKSQSNGVGLYGTIFLTPGNGGWWGQVAFYNTTLATYSLGFITGTSGVVFNAFKFLFASGNITSGTIRLYGLN
jgi:hypothetical protein